MDVFLIRHTSVNAEKGLCYGHADIDVAPTFDLEVEQIKNQLPNNIEQVFCSPLLRCIKLADALNFKSYQLDHRLKEMNFGRWEGKLWDEINPDELNPWMADFLNIRTPNGENLKDLHNRVGEFIAELRGCNHKNIAILTHAGVIRSFYSHVLDIPLNNIFKISVNYGDVLKIKLGESSDYDLI